MTVFGAILLALAAGMTEIFPVSGTGHFYMIERVLGLSLTQADRSCFQGMLYFGVTLALLLFYRHSLFSMLRELPGMLQGRRPDRRNQEASFARRKLLLWMLSSLPMLAGLLLRGWKTKLETGEHILLLVSLLLAGNGLLLYFFGRGAREQLGIRQMTLPPALVLGLAQIPSVLPGLSRMGLVLSAALAMGFDCGEAVEYAGLMGIPVFLGAGLLSCLGSGTESVTIPTALCLATVFITTLSALMTLHLLTKQMKTRKPTGFAYWCWGAAILSLVLFLISV